MAENINLKTRIVLRSDTAENWSSSNPQLLKGEIGIELDTLKFKFGDGTSNWNSLKYAGVGSEELSSAIDSTINEKLMGEDGKIKPELLPEGVGSANVYDVTKDALAKSDEEVIKAKVTALKASTTFAKGDIFIITTNVTDTIYELTGYIIASKPATNDETGVWAAVKQLNGYVDADKVILRDNITLAGNYTAVGNIEKNQTTFNTKGMSVADAFTQIFTKRLQPTITAQPAVSGFSLSGAKAVEAGTVLESVSYGTAKLSAGSYTYGPATGITATAWQVDRICAVPSTGTDLSETNIAQATSGTDNNGGNGFIIGDVAGENVVSSLKYKITATHGEGAVANDNLGGKSSPEIKISAGTKSATTSAYTSYRNFFYGATSDKPALDTAYIRILNPSNKAYAKGDYTITVNPGAQRVCIACIASATGVTKVINTSALNADVTSTFVKSQVNVEGKDGYTAVQYNVWTFEPAVAYGQEAVLKVTLG